jgi:hypothetical protein
VAAGVAFGAFLFGGQLLAPLPRLLLECSVFLVTYLGLLLFVAGQKSFYVDLVRGLKGPSAVNEKSFASA